MDWLSLSPRARLLFYLQAFSRLVFFWIPATAALGFGASFAVGPLYAAIGGVVWLFVLFLAALWVPSLAFDRWSYSLREEDLLIARGVLVRAITAIPASRIQHVDLRQGPIEQWLGLARIQIHTASGLGGDGVIPGLELEDAEVLRDQLVKVSGDGGV
ncbi:MAG: PH domain-containing protein [Myxococcota bacterium]